MQNPSGQEYEHLIAHFDRLVKTTSIFVGLIIAVGLGVFYHSLGEIRDDARVSAQAEIAKAKEQVLTEVRQRVDDEFNSKDINELVEAAAKRKAGRAIDRQIQDEVGQTVTRLQDQIVATTQIGDLAMRMRLLGYREALDELTAKYKREDDPDVRRTEKIILESVTTDYEKVWKATMLRDHSTAQQELSLMAAQRGETIPASDSNFVSVIRTDKDLNAVCLAFLALRVSTGVQFPMFDINAVEKWCAENSAKCKP
jgi:hypothetical protein